MMSVFIYRRVLVPVVGIVVVVDLCRRCRVRWPWSLLVVVVVFVSLVVVGGNCCCCRLMALVGELLCYYSTSSLSFAMFVVVVGGGPRYCRRRYCRLYFAVCRCRYSKPSVVVVDITSRRYYFLVASWRAPLVLLFLRIKSYLQVHAPPDAMI
jgi:hypothetical protein